MNAARYILLLTFLSAPIPVLADDAAPSVPATRAAAFAPGSAREAVKLYGDALPAGGMNAALAAYHSVKDKEGDLAHALARIDLAAAELENWSREKFGCQSVAEVDHAMRLPSDDDLAASTEKVEGDHATLTFPEGFEPLKMIKLDGKWKVDVAAWIVDDGGAVDDIIKTENAVADGLERLIKKARAGRYANAYLLERAIKQELYRVVGDDETEE